MKSIRQWQINSEKRTGRIVVGEIKTASFKARVIIRATFKDKDEVETIYGNVIPAAYYSFDNAVEAQKFLDAA